LEGKYKKKKEEKTPKQQPRSFLNVVCVALCKKHMVTLPVLPVCNEHETTCPRLLRVFASVWPIR